VKAALTLVAMLAVALLAGSGLRWNGPSLAFRVLGAPNPGDWQASPRLQVDRGVLTVIGTELQRIGGQLEAELHAAPHLLALQICDRSSALLSSDSARTSRWERVRYKAIIESVPSGRYRVQVASCQSANDVLVNDEQQVEVP